jgi:capsular exopolysaccharide synthesis family protein
VTNGVRDRLKLALTEQELAAKISADAPLNKVLINVHVTDHDPVQAERLANAVARQFNTVVEATDNNDTTGKPLVKLTTIHPATVPSAPITPNKVLNLGLGLVLGLLVGIGVAVLREVLDNTVKNPSDFEELGVPVLGHVPFDKRTSRMPIAFRSDLHGARSEAFRQLRTNLQFVDVDNPPRIIAVTSAIPGEGKTSTAINLAAALAEAGSRVCLIEADLRRPSVAKVLGLVGDVGFTTVVIGKAPLESVLQNAGRNLAVLTSGPIPPNPSELLLSKHAKQIIADISAKVEYTIIDTPPLLPVTDGAEIAAIADATLLVHRAAKTTRDQAGRSVEALAKVGRKPVGVVLNMITRGAGKYDYQYGYYYTTYRPETTKNKRRGKDADAQAQTAALLEPVSTDDRQVRHSGADSPADDAFTPGPNGHDDALAPARPREHEELTHEEH